MVLATPDRSVSGARAVGATVSVGGTADAGAALGAEVGWPLAGGSGVGAAGVVAAGAQADKSTDNNTKSDRDRSNVRMTISSESMTSKQRPSVGARPHAKIAQ
jgi:hypothetical protein